MSEIMQAAGLQGSIYRHLREKRGDLNSSRKCSRSLPMFSMKWLMDIGT